MSYTYNDLKVVGRERPDADQVEIGVDVDGAFFVLGSFKLQGFNIAKAEAQKAAAESQPKPTSEAQPEPTPGPTTPGYPTPGSSTPTLAPE